MSEIIWLHPQPGGTDLPPIELIGGKAWSLAILSAEGLVVPECFCVTGDFFAKMVSANSIGQQIDEIVGAGILSNQEKLEALLYHAPLPDLLAQSLYNACLRLSPVLAIRSSFSFEDTSEFVEAGQFATLLNVPNTPEAVTRALKRVWASAWGSHVRPELAAQITPHNISVVIQNFIKFERVGVVFSKNPVSTSGRTLLIEVGTPQNSVVSGGVHGVQRYLVDRTTLEFLGSEPVGDAVPDAETLQSLTQHVLNLESFFPEGADAEWGFSHTLGLCFLQARSITSRSSYGKNDILTHATPTFIAIDDSDVRHQVFGSHYKDFIRRYWSKRHWIREEAKKHNIPVPMAGFLTLSNLTNNSTCVTSIIKHHLSTPLVCIKK